MTKSIMAEDGKKAYIGIEREENVLKYIAKISGESKREITETQYAGIVKALGVQDWANNGEDEASLINLIIGEHLITK